MYREMNKREEAKDRIAVELFRQDTRSECDYAGVLHHLPIAMQITYLERANRILYLIEEVGYGIIEVRNG